MLFNSLEFAAFFPLALAGFVRLPHRFRWAWLLAASCLFYAAYIPKYLLILFVVIALDFTAGLLIARASGRTRKLILAASLLANIGILGVFKYFNFFAENVESLLGLDGPTPTLPRWQYPLPIGLSFHTFQSMSYTIEVYRGRQEAERHLGIFALYVLFFPQLVAGPIERPQNLLPQFHKPVSFDARRAVDGLKLMMTGLLKKVVIADNLAVLVDGVYSGTHASTGLEVTIATYAFAIQIFCDFSGYSDIARGCARMLGYELMENFKRPYLSRSIAEFWSRWHISLSTWFRDYLYIPLGGNRVHRWRWYANLMIVFLVSGFWHGANWTFLIWGGLHGVFLVASEITRVARTRIAGAVARSGFGWLLTPWRMVFTFHLVAVAWVFFRAASVERAMALLSGLGSGWLQPPRMNGFDLGLGGVLVAALLSAQLIEERGSVWTRVNRLPTALRWSVYYAAVIVFLLVGSSGGKEFIYFQF